MRRIAWRRVVDCNDRALRDIVVGLGGPGNGYPRQDGFDIVVASEVMAIFCLATSIKDLKERLGKIVVGYTSAQKPILRARPEGARRDDRAAARCAGAEPGADAREQPGLHPWRPVRQHRARLQLGDGHPDRAASLADYVVTEAGFGADLGAEKFVDIKCRKAGLKPAAAVIVATVRALKYHGGVEVADVGKENVAALEKGIVNLERHIDNVRNHYGLPCVVAINHRGEDTDAEVQGADRARRQPRREGHPGAHFAEGGKGAVDGRRGSREDVPSSPATSSSSTKRATPLWEKMKAIATKIYGACDITADAKVRKQIKQLQEAGYGNYPVCVAKTQYSFSTDPKLRGAPSGHMVNDPRSAAGRRRRVRRHDLRGHHDHAGTAEGALGRRHRRG